jgi:hypothetical protein
MRIQVRLELTEDQLKVISRKMKADGFDPASLQAEAGPGPGFVEKFVQQVVYDAITAADSEDRKRSF